MCGIVYIKRADGQAAGRAVAKRYRNQRHRGQEGFGYVAISKQTLSVERAEAERDILGKLLEEQADEILFHHRQPTSTPNLLDCTHPIVVAHATLKYRYYLVHNGIIGNSDALKKQHEAQGFCYTTAVTRQLLTANHRYTSHFHNDSEALAIDLALTIEGRQSDMQAEGSIAFVMVQADKERKPRRLFLGRNHGNPLMVEQHNGLIAITSENPQGFLLAADTLYAYDYETGETTHKPFQVGHYNPYGFEWDDDDWDGGGSERGEDDKIRQLQRDIDEYREYLKIAEQAGETEEAAALFDELIELEQELALYQARAF